MYSLLFLTKLIQNYDLYTQLIFDLARRLRAGTSTSPGSGDRLRAGIFCRREDALPRQRSQRHHHYNSTITISHIPTAAYDYVVNGKSAIEWVLERYAVTTHKKSGIVNDPNDWAAEVGNPRYILDLLLSVIHVSTQTLAIVAGLPQVVRE